MTDLLPPILSPVAAPASWAYRRIIEARNARYDAGSGVHRIDRPVISIGNITLGGTGKTPMVAWLVTQLREAGHNPVIAMRGYGAKRGEASDEQAEYEWKLHDAHVLANPDRVAALNTYLPEHPSIDCVVLDDGFQHRRLHRDLDLVLIDAMADTFRQRMLPAGRLREPLDNLQRADGVIVTRADGFNEEIAVMIERYHGQPPLAWARHRWIDVLVIDREHDHAESVDWLDGRKIVTLLGVGNPDAVEQQLESAGARIMAKVPAGDHEHYDQATLQTARGLAEGLAALVMTAKDWVRVQRVINLKRWPVPIAVPRVEMNVFAGANDLMSMVKSAARKLTSEDSGQMPGPV